MSAADNYLRLIIERLRIDTGPYSPARVAQATLRPSITAWAGQFLLGMEPSGSFAKGTAIHGGTDIDLFLSLSSTTPDTLAAIYNSLFERLRGDGFAPRRQNVSIGTTVDGFSVDLVPAKRQDASSLYHSLYRSKANTWTQTNVQTHINAVRSSNRIEEILILKAWRNQKGLDFPSFYLELATIAACAGRSFGDLAENVMATFSYLRDHIRTATFIDPANTNNRISDDLTVAGKLAAEAAAAQARAATNWNQVVV